MLMGPTVALAVLPLPSVAVRVTDWAAPSPERITSAGHVTTPELSAQVKWIVTGPLFQPFPFGAGVAVPVMDGAVLSMTVIVWTALAGLPEASAAVYARVMISGLAGEPAPPFLDSSTVTTAVPQLSFAVAPGAGT